MENKWYKAPEMVKERSKHSCCILGNKLYAFKGRQGDRNMNHKSIEWIDA